MIFWEIWSLSIQIARYLEAIYPASLIKPKGIIASIALNIKNQLKKFLLLNLARVPVEIFVRGPLNPSIWLGRIPVLNIFESLMLVLGAYSFWLKRSLDRTKVLVVGLVISLALITFNGATEITLILPFLYMMVAAGVVYMWDLWHSVFPTNPVAKSAGILILGVAIIFSCGYHAREYFVAWPNSPPTNAAYTQKLPEIWYNIRCW